MKKGDTVIFPATFIGTYANVGAAYEHIPLPAGLLEDDAVLIKVDDVFHPNGLYFWEDKNKVFQAPVTQ